MLCSVYKYKPVRSVHIAYMYIHKYFIDSSPRGFSESILHYTIKTKYMTMIKKIKVKKIK